MENGLFILLLGISFIIIKRRLSSSDQGTMSATPGRGVKRDENIELNEAS